MEEKPVTVATPIMEITMHHTDMYYRTFQENTQILDILCNRSSMDTNHRFPSTSLAKYQIFPSYAP